MEKTFLNKTTISNEEAALNKKNISFESDGKGNNFAYIVVCLKCYGTGNTYRYIQKVFSSHKKAVEYIKKLGFEMNTPNKTKHKYFSEFGFDELIIETALID